MIDGREAGLKIRKNAVEAERYDVDTALLCAFFESLEGKGRFRPQGRSDDAERPISAWRSPCWQVEYPARQRGLQPSPLARGKMRPVVEIIGGVFGHQAAKMALIEHDDMIEKVAAAVADEALGYTILPRTFEGCSLRLNAERLHRISDLGVEDGIAVVDHVLDSGLLGKCIAQLLRHPSAGRMSRDRRSAKAFACHAR